MRAELLAGLLPIAVIAALPLARWFAPPPIVAGVTARYYANDSWEGPPLLETIDRDMSLASINAHPEVSRLPRFTVEWTGTLFVRQSHLLRFITTSDDGSWLWIGERSVVDNGGIHAAERKTGDIWLERGAHALRVRYHQAGGDAALEVGQWARGGVIAPLAPVAPQAVSYRDFRRRELWPLAYVALMYLSFVPLVVIAIRRALRSRAASTLRESLRDPALWAVAVFGVSVAVAHINYGVAEHAAFSADELTPLDTLEGSRRQFREWNPRWPPGHPTLQAIVLAPFVVANARLGLPLLDPVVAPLMLLIVRALSVLMLFATFVLTFDVARTLADRRTAIMTIALVATAPLVVYFGALANLEVPHLFWVTASWWTWIQFWRQPDAGFGILFGLIVGISMGVKDQAYAFYLAAPFAIVGTLWRDRGERPLADVVRDRRLWIIGVATIVAFAVAQGIPWAWDRFLRHVAVMTTDTRLFQMFARNVVGYVQLLGAIGKTLVWAAGVPLAAVFLGGVVDELVARRGKRLALLLLPIATYAVAFFGLTMYVYDRFFIACLPVVAFVGGRFLSGLTRQRSLPIAFRAGIPALVLTIGAINAAAQNVLFHGDARSPATTWITQNIPCGSRIGVAYDTNYIPSVGCFDVLAIRPSEIWGITDWPEYLVFNDMYVRRFLDTPAGTEFLQRLYAGKLGYRPVYRSEAAVPKWAPLLWEQRFRNNREDPETTLDKPINAIQVWKRQTD